MKKVEEKSFEDTKKTLNQIRSEVGMKPIKDSGNRTQFHTGAVRDMHQGKGRCDLLPPNALLRLARHFESGSLKYGDRNWELGIPCHSFADSALRHYLRYMAGDTDEDHLMAAIWNLLCLAETEQLRPEMQDIPSRLKDNKESAHLKKLAKENDPSFTEQYKVFQAMNGIGESKDSTTIMKKGEVPTDPEWC